VHHCRSKQISHSFTHGSLETSLLTSMRSDVEKQRQIRADRAVMYCVNSVPLREMLHSGLLTPRDREVQILRVTMFRG